MKPDSQPSPLGLRPATTHGSFTKASVTRGDAESSLHICFICLQRMGWLLANASKQRRMTLRNKIRVGALSKSGLSSAAGSAGKLPPTPARHRSASPCERNYRRGPKVSSSITERFP